MTSVRFRSMRGRQAVAPHYAQDSSGKVTEEAIPDNLKSRVTELRNELMEAVAESGDARLEKYFEAGELSEEDLKAGFKKAIITRTVVPVLCSAATRNVGVKSLLDFIVDYLPAPNQMPSLEYDGKKRNPSSSDPLAALAFKTVAEAHVGELSLVRVSSGILKPGDEVLNAKQNKSGGLARCTR